MSKQIHDPTVTLTFSHSLPFAHVLSYLRTAVTIRRSARYDREMAEHLARYGTPRTYKLAEGLVERAERESRRAEAYEHLVRIMQPLPNANEVVANYLSSVMNPRRSGEDLKMVADIIAEQGLDGIELMAKYGFQRSDYAVSLGRKMIGVGGSGIIDYVQHIDSSALSKRTDEETRNKNAKIGEAIKEMLSASNVSFQVDERSQIDELDKFFADHERRSLREVSMERIEKLTAEERLTMFCVQFYSLPLDYRIRIDKMYYGGRTTQAIGTADKQQLNTLVRMCFLDFDEKTNTYTINEHALVALTHKNKPSRFSMFDYGQFTFRADRAIHLQDEPTTSATGVVAPNGEGEKGCGGGEKDP